MRAVYVPPELEAEVEAALAARGLFLRGELKGAHSRPVVRAVPRYLRKESLMPAHPAQRAVA